MGLAIQFAPRCLIRPQTTLITPHHPDQQAHHACYIFRATPRVLAASVSKRFASSSRELYWRLGREASKRGKCDEAASRADFESSCKGKETRAISEKEGPSKSDMQKETILKAREISIEHLRKVPGRFLAADKNLLQTFHRRVNIHARCDDDGVQVGQLLVSQVDFCCRFEDVDWKLKICQLQLC